MMSALPLAATINHLLARQPSLTSLLKTHAGKTACFDVGGFRLFLYVTGEGLLRNSSQAQADEAQPAVTIRIQPADRPHRPPGWRAQGAGRRRRFAVQAGRCRGQRPAAVPRACRLPG